MCKKLFQSKLSWLFIVPLIFLIINLAFFVYFSFQLPKKNCPNTEECYAKYLNQGISYHGQDQHDKAITAFQKAVQYQSDSFVPYANIGTSYRKKGDFKKAEEYFKKALEKSPGEFLVYYKIYELYYYDLKKGIKEMQDFFADAAIKTNGNVELIKTYAVYLEEINDLESALLFWKDIAKDDPSNDLYQNKVKELQAKISNK